MEKRIIKRRKRQFFATLTAAFISVQSLTALAGANNEWSWTPATDTIDENTNPTAVYIDGSGNNVAATVTPGASTDADCLNAKQKTYSARTNDTVDGDYLTDTKTYTVGDPLWHNYGAPVYEWTLNAAGDAYTACKATFTCSRCAVGTDGHVAEANAITITSQVDTAATCTTKGKTKYTAIFNDDDLGTYAAAGLANQTITLENIPINPANHTNLVKHAAVTATCAAGGNIEYWECDGCHNKYNESTGTSTPLAANAEKTAINPTNHTNLVKHDAVTATCVSGGNITYWECDGCHNKYNEAAGTSTPLAADAEKTAINPTNHTNLVKHDAVTATCVAGGNITYWECDGCHNKYNEATGTSTPLAANAEKTAIDPNNHDWDTPTYTWAKNADGTYNCTAQRICKRDASHKDTETVSNIVGTETTAATTSAPGVRTFTANFTKNAFSQQTTTEVIPQLEAPVTTSAPLAITPPPIVINSGDTTTPPADNTPPPEYNDGDVLTVSDPHISGDLLKNIKGKDVTIVIDLGNGIKWIINGKSITGDPKDIDFSVSINEDSEIPVEVINKVTGERTSITIHLEFDGEFGLEATLEIQLDPNTGGYWANLYYYNPETGDLELIDCALIDENGTVTLKFVHASDYTIVIDDRPLDGRFDNDDTSEIDIGTEEEIDIAPDVQEPNPDTGSKALPLVMFMISGLAMIAFDRRRK